MYTLYYSPGTASLVVHWLLLELSAPHELRLLDVDAREHKQPAYLALNPNGVIPTLLIDGEPVHETAALVLHLADAYPDARLAPDPGTFERARCYQWMAHLTNTLQSTYRYWFYPDEAAGPDGADTAQEKARQAIEATWDRIDAHLANTGPHMLGERVSVVDFMLTMLMRWSRRMPRPATEWPHLRALAERMKARPTFKRLYEIEGLTDWT